MNAVDVLTVIDDLIDFEERHAEYERRANHEAREARAAVAELIEAASVIAVHQGDATRSEWERLDEALAGVQGQTP